MTPTLLSGRVRKVGNSVYIAFEKKYNCLVVPLEGKELLITLEVLR